MRQTRRPDRGCVPSCNLTPSSRDDGDAMLACVGSVQITRLFDAVLRISSRSLLSDVKIPVVIGPVREYGQRQSENDD